MSQTGINGILETSISQTLAWYVHQNHLENLLTHRLLGTVPEVCNSVGLGWDPRNPISKKFLGEAGAVCLRTPPWESQ
jgi:hypothetical protein